MLSKPFTQLSKNVLCPQKNRRFTVVSLPKGMEVREDGSFIVTEKTPTIAVLDDFYVDAKIAFDVISTHGDIVTKYAVAGLEDQVGVLACNVKNDGRINRTASDSFDPLSHPINEALQFFIQIQKEYQNIIAVNISMAITIVTRYFLDECGLDVTKASKAEVLEAIRHEAIRLENNLVFRPSYHIIQSVNELIDLGVEVYIATGNDDDETINSFTLSNAHAVSSCDTKSDNELFGTEEAAGSHTFRKKFDKTGKLLYITDGIIRFHPDEMETRKRIGLLDILFPWYRVNGTSYACPIKLNKDVKTRLKQNGSNMGRAACSSDPSFSATGE